MRPRLDHVISMNIWRRKFVTKHCRALLIGFVLFAGAILSSPALAIPVLQLYIEGATYDSATESWRIVTDGTLILWIIGNVGQYGEIHDVHLAAAVKADEKGTITLEPTTATINFGVSDLSPPEAPTPTTNFPSEEGQIPKLSNGEKLPKHDAYGPGVRFYEWKLGNFTLTDSPIGDFSGSFPTTFPKKGQINAYIVTITGFPSGVHFDAYNHVWAQQSGKFKYHFAPFSHDASWHTPEPTVGLLVLLGCFIAALQGRPKTSCRRGVSRE